METNRPSWSDQYTPEELVAALDHQAAQLSHRYGLYDIANELRAAAECIDELVESNDQLCTELASLAGSALGLSDNLGKIERTLRSSIESFSKTFEVADKAAKAAETESQVDDSLDRGEFR
jgi:hypothetical protein